LKYRLLIALYLLHFGLSLTGFLGLQSWVLSAQDAGIAACGSAWLEIPVHFGLLQPVAHWVLRWASLAWWTWSGLATLTVLIGLNSLVAFGVLWGFLRVIRVWRSAA